MNAVDYLMSRLTLFVIVCIIWLALNGHLHLQVESLPQEPSNENVQESNEPPRTNKLRPVNLMIINDTSNRFADKSIVQSLNTMYELDSNSIGRVITIKVNGDNPKDDLERICDIWDTVVKEQSSDVPDLVLDPTTSGFAAETVSAFTAAVGVPTLSAQYGLEGDMKNWNFHNRTQSKHLVQIIPPMDLISESARQFVYQMNISNAAVIFDEEFIMDYRYKNLFDNSRTRFVVVPMRRTVNEVHNLLLQMRRLDIVNFFIFGNVSTIKTVLNVGCLNNFFGPEYGWYILSQYDEEPQCDCKKLSIMNLKPLKTPTIKERANNLGMGKWRIEPILSAAFYFDFVRLGITAMKASILKGKWPTNSEYLTCKAFNSSNTPSIHFDYYSELVEASDESRFHPTFASFVWGGRNGRNYAKFEMIAKMITVNRSVIVNSEEVGTWSGRWHSQFQIKNETAIKKHIGVLRYRITTVLKEPFVMYNPATEVWSGYCIDLIDKLASKLNFTYSISAVKDQEYGMMNQNGRWNGMIRELLLKRADIALGALSVMTERENVIDFTVPFYDLVGFSILMRKPKRPTKLFKFLSVLADEVWLGILGSLFLTSIFLSIFNRWSPYSYRNNLEKFLDDDEKRDFTLRESLWFSMTSLTPQGGGIAPKNLSGRLVAATWWLFGFIIIASYTANLSAFLTVSRLETMVESLEDLSKQYRIQYAPIFGSEAYMYFKRMADIEERFYEIWRDLSLSSKITELERSKLGVYEYPLSYEFTKMMQSMIEFKFPRNISEALERVRRENNRTAEFAFIGDAADIKYLTMINCDLQEVGSEFSRKPYALAVQQGSPLREPLNNAILQLSNERELEKLKNRWWKKNPAQVECEEQELLSDGISMANIGGVFVVTFAGIGLAILTLLFEYYWYRVRPQNKQNFNRQTSPTAKEEKKKKKKKSNEKSKKIAFQSDEIKMK